ncbi:MAG: hypothetical protein J3K34DRAFT_160587 [Monoraphidium minutum]|nr:MAG: hypothetical protein J3K34DRAFT_160587 [Monoraphidium minutum]
MRRKGAAPRLGSKRAVKAAAARGAKTRQPRVRTGGALVAVRPAERDARSAMAGLCLWQQPRKHQLLATAAPGRRTQRRQLAGGAARQQQRGQRRLRGGERRERRGPRAAAAADAPRRVGERAPRAFGAAAVGVGRPAERRAQVPVPDCAWWGGRRVRAVYTVCCAN